MPWRPGGGRRLARALVAQPGLRAAEPGEFTRRAFANGRIDLTEAEGLADLLEAETEAQRRGALAPAEGGLRRQIEQWRARLVDLSAEAEAAIDYVDEEDGGARVRSRAAARATLADELDDWLAGRGSSRCATACGSSSRARPTPESRAWSMRLRAKRGRSSPRFPGTTRDHDRGAAGDRRRAVRAGRHRRACARPTTGSSGSASAAPSARSRAPTSCCGSAKPTSARRIRARLLIARQGRPGSRDAPTGIAVSRVDRRGDRPRSRHGSSTQAASLVPATEQPGAQRAPGGAARRMPRRASRALEHLHDLVLIAEHLRTARDGVRPVAGTRASKTCSTRCSAAFASASEFHVKHAVFDFWRLRG